MKPTIQKIKVRNVISSSSGRQVPNQFIITTENGEYFQSYEAIIAARINSGGRICTLLDETMWDCSVTTGRYRNKFLMDDGIAETRKRIKNGDYKLVNLNP